MEFENRTPIKEVEMKTISDLGHISHIRISWKECFKFWFSFAIVVTITLVIYIVFLNIFENYVF
ncbi:hypothetical protein [Methanolobus psychrotolerans]|uniref:hypothetical protein n=1 Tax=Methanolobus psychrotolerans TaxID=1874706 RepID=UPI000B91B016|nr:hypothetical protein [Methanolobus psychrotolerans]